MCSGVWSVLFWMWKFRSLGLVASKIWKPGKCHGRQRWPVLCWPPVVNTNIGEKSFTLLLTGLHKDNWSQTDSRHCLGVFWEERSWNIGVICERRGRRREKILDSCSSWNVRVSAHQCIHAQGDCGLWINNWKCTRWWWWWLSSLSSISSGLVMFNMHNGKIRANTKSPKDLWVLCENSI